MIHGLGILDRTPPPNQRSQPRSFALNAKTAAGGSKENRPAGVVRYPVPRPKADGFMAPEILAMAPNRDNVSLLISRVGALSGHRLVNPENPSEVIAWEHRSGLQIVGRYGELLFISHVNLPHIILIANGLQPDIRLLRNGNAYSRGQMTDREKNVAMGLLKFAATAAQDRDERNWRRAAM
jgi:hypothetical protein